MHAHRIIVPVPASRRVEIELPPDFPEGDAEIIALSAERPSTQPGKPRRGSIEAMRAADAIIDKMDFPRRTKEEIDAYLEEERASWGDDP